MRMELWYHKIDCLFIVFSSCMFNPLFFLHLALPEKNMAPEWKIWGLNPKATHTYPWWYIFYNNSRIHKNLFSKLAQSSYIILPYKFPIIHIMGNLEFWFKKTPIIYYSHAKGFVSHNFWGLLCNKTHESFYVWTCPKLWISDDQQRIFEFDCCSSIMF